MDLNRLLKNAGLEKNHAKGDMHENLISESKDSNELDPKKVTNNPELIQENVIIETYDGSNISYNKETGEYFDEDYQIKISENDPRIRLNNLEEDYTEFKEAAGTLTRQNTTADVKKGTLKKMGDRLGFEITDDGIPPIISKDSWKR